MVSEELKAARASLYDIFENEITDENIQKIIFGNEGYSQKILKDTNAYPLYFKNILFLTYYYILACYQRDMRMGPQQSTIREVDNHLAERIKKYLGETLSVNSITMDLVDFVLADVQQELALGNKSNLRIMLRHLGDFDPSFRFRAVIKTIIEYEREHSRAEYSRESMTQLLLQLVSTLSFLGKYRLQDARAAEGDDQQTLFNFRWVTEGALRRESRGIRPNSDQQYEDLPLPHFIIKHGGCFYRLYSIEKGEKDEGEQRLVIRLRYLSMVDDSPLVFTVPRNDDEPPHHLDGIKPQALYTHLLMSKLDPHKPMHTIDQGTVSIGQIHTINYRHLKHLALAISDTLSVHSFGREALRNKFRSAYPYLFVSHSGDPDDQNALDWDSVILMLLIEASPTAVIETIIRSDKSSDKPLFCDLGLNLYQRVCEAAGLKMFTTHSRAQIVAAVRQIMAKHMIVGEAGGYGRLTEGPDRPAVDLFPQAATILLLSALSAQDDIDDELSYTGNLTHNISFLKREQQMRNTDPAKSVRYACVILGETLKHIMSFYAGLERYGAIKDHFDGDTRYRILSKDEIQKAQKKLSDTFLMAAQQQANDLSATLTETPDAVLSLLETFIAFCNQFSQTHNATKSKNLCTAVGRFELLDVGRFTRLIQPLKSIDTQNLNSDTAAEWVGVTVNVLEFFKSGSTQDLHMEGDLLNAVYPFTAVFRKDRKNTDGYTTVTFSLNLDPDADEGGHEINVLSEFNYNHHDVFYCLPNVIRSNYKWWIDPVLISFRDFNRIFEKNGKEDE